MIHPELRAAARLIRLFLPAFTLRKLKAFRRLVRLLRGRHTRRLRYEQKYLPRPDGSRLRLCIYTPLEPAGDAPGILWLHGGGYAFGAPEQDEVFIRRCIDAGVRLVVSPDYTLSVDAPYPAALEDCYAALVWMKERKRRRHREIKMSGGQRGGRLARPDAIRRYKKEVAIAFQLLLYPCWTQMKHRIAGTTTRRYELKFKRRPELYGRAYRSPDVTAMPRPQGRGYERLPPACSYVGGNEPFARDGRL
jgi:acetyl esterase/lipase